MYRHRMVIRSRRFTNLWLARIILSSLMLMCVPVTVPAQEVQREQPQWWYGGAVGANLNFYGGTTQMLNSGLTVPAAFHRGFGIGVFLAPLVEYRPDSVWGVILHVGYDGRRGSFGDVPCPCGEIATLSATPSYITIEPSLRFAPFSNGWYMFLGPRIGINWAPIGGDEKTFVYTQGPLIASKGQFSEMRGTVFSGQIGVGYEFALSLPNDEHQVNVSPFISYQPYFGQDPRSVETWAISTLRIGAEIKFGSGDVIPQPDSAMVEREVEFSIRAPKAVPVKRRVRETFPLRNYVFFEEGMTDVPDRYVTLTKEEAASFKEEQLQEVPPKSMTGRSLRQMTVYYNILNILGDRMKRSPGTAIMLSGSSGNGPEFGKERAETIKRYLVEVFGIDSMRIATEGRDKPRIPSEVPGATKELALLRAGDQRVDIESASPELMIQAGGGPHYMLKPVQIVAVVEDPLDSHVLFNVVGAKSLLSSWSLEITDERGKVQRYGPSTRDRESISGNTILGDRSQGDYKVVMLGQTKNGRFVKRESSVRLIRREEPKKEAVRFSILFDFDQSKTIASYEKFLTDIVTPLIPDNGVVVIHGHTDITGDEEYNDNLSRERVQDAKNIFERAIPNRKQRGITFETFGFGEDLQYAPFDNYYPEGRFYNRAVIIDIVPN